MAVYSHGHTCFSNLPSFFLILPSSPSSSAVFPLYIIFPSFYLSFYLSSIVFYCFHETDQQYLVRGHIHIYPPDDLKKYLKIAREVLPGRARASRDLLLRVCEVGARNLSERAQLLDRGVQDRPARRNNNNMIIVYI